MPLPRFGPKESVDGAGDPLWVKTARMAESGRLDGKGGLSPRIIHLMHQVLNGALKQAVREHLIQHNPAEYTVRPSIKRLGHTKTSTTLDLYCHSIMEGKKKAVERLKTVLFPLS